MSQSLYQLLLENMHSAVLLLDKQLHILYMNTSAEILLKTSSHRGQSAHIEHVFSEVDQTNESLAQAIENGQPFNKRKTRLRLSAHGEEIMVDYSITPLNEPANTLLMELQPLDRALTIRKEEMLLSSQEVSRKLVRNLAHEIKNPLGGLRGAAQLLERELSNESLKDYTHIIIKEADRLRNLVDQMLGPNNALNMKTTNAHEILERVRKLLRAESQQNIDNVIDIRFDYDPSIPDIEGDKEQLIQAILNIARNAFQALTENKTAQATLIFRTRIQRQFTISQRFHKIILHIDIEDNGPGIKPELHENLFFPMITGREQGTGLGLSIAQTIINQHHGLIKFDTSAGKTVFSLFLPLKQQTHKKKD